MNKHSTTNGLASAVDHCLLVKGDSLQIHQSGFRQVLNGV